MANPPYALIDTPEHWRWFASLAELVAAMLAERDGGGFDLTDNIACWGTAPEETRPSVGFVIKPRGDGPHRHLVILTPREKAADVMAACRAAVQRKAA